MAWVTVFNLIIFYFQGCNRKNTFPFICDLDTEPISLYLLSLLRQRLSPSTKYSSSPKTIGIAAIPILTFFSLASERINTNTDTYLAGTDHSSALLEIESFHPGSVFLLKAFPSLYHLYSFLINTKLIRLLSSIPNRNGLYKKIWSISGLVLFGSYHNQTPWSYLLLPPTIY